jgi:hypothetical protein
MLNYRDGRLIFWLMCLAIFVGIMIQLGMAVAFVAGGTLSSKLLGSILNGGIVAACIPTFRKLLEKHFISKEILPFSRLHHYASDRSDTLRDTPIDSRNAFLLRQSLIAKTLRLAEETLHGWCPGSHFELCVFIDADQPLLFSYFDSKRDYIARSMAERARSPTFYLDKHYEVTKLLRNPTSHPKVIRDTYDKKANYFFVTPEQKKQVRSTFLLCIDINMPCALVITSDAKNAFSLTDDQQLSFIRFVADLVKYDLFEADFIRNIKYIRPDLFPHPGNALGYSEPVSEQFPSIAAPEAGSKDA